MSVGRSIGRLVGQIFDSRACPTVCDCLVFFHEHVITHVVLVGRSVRLPGKLFDNPLMIRSKSGDGLKFFWFCNFVTHLLNILAELHFTILNMLVIVKS